jgi:hypothetical protein
MSADPAKPVIIIGAGRSGTSLLHAMLDAHPAIHMCGEFQFATFDLWRALAEVPAARHEMSTRIRRRAQRIHGSEDISDAVAFSTARALAEEEGKRIGSIARSALAELYALNARAETHWGFKEIWFLTSKERNWDPFDVIFPEACYIHMVRDPADFVRSVVSWNRTPPTVDNVRQLLLEWMSYVFTSRERRKTGRYVLVQYERLVASPRSTMNDVLARLGLELDEACLSAMETKYVASVTRAGLPPGFAELVEGIEGFRDLMADYGYELPAPDETDAAEASAEVLPLAQPVDDQPRRLRLLPPFVADTGKAWQVSLSLSPLFSELNGLGDDLDHLERSPLRLSEDGAPLGPPHARHLAIRQHGGGRYSHWALGHVLLFSTSDNSDPNANGREYCVEW